MQRHRSAVDIKPVAIEPLEGRSLFAAVSFHAQIAPLPAALANLKSQAVAGVALPNGKLIALGYVDDGQGKTRNFFVRYNTDGSLDQTFGSGGVAIQSVARMATVGYAYNVYAMPDGSALVCMTGGGGGMRRLMAAGQFDTAYGTNGILPIMPESMQRQSDGTTLTVIQSGLGNRLARLNMHGDLLRYSALQAYKTGRRNTTQALSDGRVATLGIDGGNRNTLILTDTGFKPIQTFGDHGTLDLIAPIHQWISAKGRGYDQTGLLQSPYWQVNKVSTARDGGYVVDIALYATQAKVTQTEMTDGVITWLHVRLSAKGKIVSINGDDNRSATAFYEINNTLGGTFHFDRGADVTINPTQERGEVQATAAGSGAYYIIGELGYSSSAAGTRFAVIVMHPPGGTISGTLFNDHDHDGVFDAGESINADRSVYIDSNNDGKLDPGEETTTTDRNGRYSFADLGSGDYFIRRVLPSDYSQTSSAAPVSVITGKHAVFNIGSSATK